LQKVSQLLRHDSLPVSDIYGSKGPIQIQGRSVEGAEGTVTAPFSGSSCLLYTYELKKRRGTGANRLWEPIDEGRDSVNFVVDDGTGRVTVDPTGADVAIDDHSQTIKPGSKLPERLAEHVAQTPDIEPQDPNPLSLVTDLTGGSPLRFTERRLEVDDDVFVYGQVTRGNAGRFGSDTVADGAGTSPFVISDKNTAGTTWRIARRALLLLGFGVLALLAVVGAVFGVPFM
jgi:hypothetical protein